jgi:Icc-related predicted phosphoesterase
MLIRAYSDLHGRLPAIAPCDALLIAGDICPIVGGHAPATQAEYLSGIFRQWCEALPAEQIVLIPGNHDFAIESLKAGADYELAENVTLLIDQGVELGGGPKVFGQPWVPDLVAWAFHATDQELAEKAAAIPDGYDIWLQHGPPACSEGIEEYRLDLVNPQHVGNRSLEAAIRKKQPQAVICGHIHEGFGGARFGESLVANVSFLDEFYETQWRHLELEWNDGEAVRTELVIEGDGQLAWDCIAAAGEL